MQSFHIKSSLNDLLAWYLKRRIKKIERYKKDANFAQSVQEQTLSHLVKKAKQTAFGKEHHFSQIKNLEDFKKLVPLQDYENLKNYTEQIFRGETNVLWPGSVKWFAKSSGTTNDKSKFIPLSKDALRIGNYQAGGDIMAYYCQNNPKAKPFMGKGIIIGGSHQLSQLNPNISCGDLSSVLIQTLPSLVRYLSDINIDIALMDEWEAKIERLAEYYLPKNVTSISGVPSWALVLVKHILQKTGKKTIEEVWPNFEVLIHGGVSFEPYRNQFEQLMPKAKFVETYNASEGFFAFQDEAINTGMLLILDYGIFFEFLPLSEIDKAHPETKQLSEVELEEEYALVISTNAGLWRYVIGDVIEFSSLLPYRIRITGRTKHFINVFGEEVMVGNTDKALALTCEKHQATVIEYTVAPIFMEQEKGGHEWLIEFQEKPKDLKTFAKDLDQNLKNLNSDYEAKRYKDMVLEELKITAVPEGTFYQWMKNKDKLGGQHKVPRLFNSRVFLEEIMDSL